MTNRIRRNLLVAAAALGAAVPAGCGQANLVTVEVEAKLWQAELDTEFKSSTDLLAGDRIGFESTLDLDDEEDLWVGRAGVTEAADTLSVQYWAADRDGETTLDRTFNFEGRTYTDGEFVESSTEVQMIRIAWERDLSPAPTFRLRSLIGVNLVEALFEVEGAAAGRAKWDENFSVPVIGFSSEVMLPMGFTIYGELAGLWSEIDSFEGSYYETEMGLRWRSERGKLFFSTFVRRFEVDFEHDDAEGRIEVEGPGFAAGILF